MDKFNSANKTTELAHVGCADNKCPPEWRQVHISAIRQMLVRDKKDILGPQGDAEPVEIYIDLNGADPAVVLPQIKEKLFFPAVYDTVAAIPTDLRDKVPGSLRKADKTRLPPCDCAARDTDACVNRDAATGWKHPQVLHVVDPHYTDEARKKRLNGTVSYRSLWILRDALSTYGLQRRLALD